MTFLALVDAPLSSESMIFPVFSLLTGNSETETSSLVTASSSGESAANSDRGWLERGARFANDGADRLLAELCLVDVDHG